jgi:hypothetical protein
MWPSKSPTRISSPEDVELYIQEARTVAALDHPRIVSVYDVGRTEDGSFFFVSKFIEGCNLAERIKVGPLTHAEAAEIIAVVAEALHHAHQRGLVHRDIKPANILLDDAGHSLVADFGLAVHEDQQRDRAGEVSGTPGYMAPEQVRGEVHHFDGRTDIWSVGAVLYVLLTNRRPFAGDTTQSLFDEIEHREPKPPRQIDDTIPLQLEQIVLKCLRKEIANRYTTAKDLADELRLWLNDTGLPSSISTSSSGAHSTTIKTDQQSPRKPLTAIVRTKGYSLTLAVGLAGLLIAIGLIWLKRREQDTLGVVGSPLDGAVTGGAPLPSSKLTATIDVRLWEPDDEKRRGLSLAEPGMLPLKTGDKIRIEANVSDPAYLYLIWIGSDGNASPVYPWKPGDWHDRPEDEEPVTRISLPKQHGVGWPMQGAAGMESLLLLVRKTPLPRDIDLREFLSGLPWSISSIRFTGGRRQPAGPEQTRTKLVANGSLTPSSCEKRARTRNTPSTGSAWDRNSRSMKPSQSGGRQSATAKALYQLVPRKADRISLHEKFCDVSSGRRSNLT